MTSTPCPSCGAREIRWSEGRYACVYCGATITPRLEPGTLCSDLEGGCLQPAQTLCRRCARPLCDRHNDPKTIYWNSTLLYDALFPQWDSQNARDWWQLTKPFQKFPVPGVENLDWQPYERRSLREVAHLEERIRTVVDPVVRSGGGAVREYVCLFESLCLGCEKELRTEMVERVLPFVGEYRSTAFVNRLEAIEADLKQARSYITAFLGRDPTPLPEELRGEAQYTQLTADSPPDEWDRCGWEVERRLGMVKRLIGRVYR